MKLRAAIPTAAMFVYCSLTVAQTATAQPTGQETLAAAMDVYAFPSKGQKPEQQQTDAGAISVSPAFAQSTAPKQEGWQFDIVPYVWGAGLEGDVKLGRLPTQGIEASFSDIWNSLNIAGMAAFEARKGKWGVLVDAIYIDLSGTVPTPEELVFGQAKVSMKQQLYSGLITYRIHDSKKLSVDLGWGARYYRIDTDLELTSGIAQGRTRAAKVDWSDWLAGARVVGHPSKRWSLIGYADIGGGGSDLTWEAIAGADFAFNKTVSLAFGYRHLSVDYDENQFLYDVSMAGPYLGLGFHF